MGIDWICMARAGMDDGCLALIAVFDDSIGTVGNYLESGSSK